MKGNLLRRPHFVFGATVVTAGGDDEASSKFGASAKPGSDTPELGGPATLSASTGRSSSEKSSGTVAKRLREETS